MTTACDYCVAPANKNDGRTWYTEDIWGIKTWCSNCEEEAAWDIYNDVLDEIAPEVEA